jgi:hypothetical protein
MTKYFKATFSDGTTLTRSSVSRTYTHAWRAGQRTSGFSGSAELARKAASGAGLPNGEVAACVEISRGDWRMHGKETRDKGSRLARTEDSRTANHVDGYDRDDLGESPDY